MTHTYASLKGYEICECGQYAHIYAPWVLERLPEHYHGELCAECGMWMCHMRYLDPEWVDPWAEKEEA